MAKRMRAGGLVFGFVALLLPLLAQGDAARLLEAAIHREVVNGDLAGAMEAYRAISSDASAPHPIAARALLRLAQCQEKMGLRREAHTTYTRILREFTGESEIAAQARSRLTLSADAMPGPRNLRFEEGDTGRVPPGWFVPVLEKTTGSLAELQRSGCHSGRGCAVLVAPATAPGMVGNLMQSFSAAAYRGRSVRLRAWIKVEPASPEDRAQMWLHVFRPNGRSGFFDNMDDRPVRPSGWTSCEIAGEIDGDALFVDFGVTAIGRGQVWVDDVTFDLLPDEPATISGPRNLRFEQGDAGKVPPGWFVPALETGTGSLAELRRKGCRTGGCAVVVAPEGSSGVVGHLMQSFSAAAYRGRTVRLRAWVKVEGGSADDRAQMWLHVLRTGGKPGFSDDMDDRPVRPSDWTACEIVTEVDGDAQFLDFGITAIGRGRVWLDEVAFDVVPEDQIFAARTAVSRQYGDRVSMTAFRYAGSQVITVVRAVSLREGFPYVETFQDTWRRAGEQWNRVQRVPMAGYYEAPNPSAPLLRAIASDLLRYASPLGAVYPQISSDCLALHRPDLPQGAAESVLSSAKLGPYFLDVGRVAADSELGRWLHQPHLFGGRPVVLGQQCKGLLFVEAAPGSGN